MENKTIIEELYFCAAQCVSCYNACEREKDKEKFERCMALDKDCEDVCRLTAQILERNPENGELLLKVCSDICVKCAAECEKHSSIEHCKQCAEVCRKCAEMCLIEETAL